jgi:hypothetical protein
MGLIDVGKVAAGPLQPFVPQPRRVLLRIEPGPAFWYNSAIGLLGEMVDLGR